MKKNLIRICIVVVVALCISFFVWWNRTIHVADIIDFNRITKVEIWSGNNCVTLAEDGDIKKFTDILDSMKLKNWFQREADGFVFFINIFYENNEQNDLTLFRDINIGGRYYRCDRNYCDDMRKLYDSFQT